MNWSMFDDCLAALKQERYLGNSSLEKAFSAMHRWCSSIFFSFSWSLPCDIANTLDLNPSRRAAIIQSPSTTDCPLNDRSNGNGPPTLNRTCFMLSPVGSVVY